MLEETWIMLGLTGHTVSMARKVAGKLESATFTDPEVAEAWLEGAEDSYLCANPCRAGTVGKPSEADMLPGQWLLVDCDPAKDAEDPTGTSSERRDAAWTVASEIWEHFGQRGVLVDSGRGAQVWLRVMPGADRRGLTSWIRDEFRASGVVVDSTFELSRLQRVPETPNSRTGEHVVVVDQGDEAMVTREDVEECLSGWMRPESIEVGEPDRGPPSQREIRRYLRGEALSIWREDPMEITADRSRRDYRFLRLVMEAGADLQTASRLLHALPGSKASERADSSYWESTAGAAVRAIDETRECERIVSELAGLVRVNPRVVLEKNTIKALAHLRTTNYAGWAEMRATLKDALRPAGISIADVDRLVVAEQARKVTSEAAPPDDVAVFVRNEDGGKGAWKVRDQNGGWTWVGRTDVELVLQNAGRDPLSGVSLALQAPFTIALQPFKPRILPGRSWNESNARFAVSPEAGPHPTWDQLFRVVGRGLDSDVLASSWARDNGVATGADYLLLWVASMLQDPLSRRAYLFLYSREQGTGKSLFFESAKLLIGSAVVKANNALQNDRGFNGELRNAVLAYTEEVNLGSGGGRNAIYNRIKDWSLSDTMTIEAKGSTCFEVPNVVSWGQAANDPSYCPVFEGDDRITIYQVLPPLDEERIPKEVMRERLRQEAPAFLATLLAMEVPAPVGRYVVPPLSTEAKRQQARASRDDLSVWLDANPGWVTLTDDALVDGFRDYLAQRDLGKQFWPPQRILRALPELGDAARGVYVRLRDRAEGRWTATEAAEDFGLGSARRAGQVMRILSSGWDRLSEGLTGGVRVYSLR